MTRKHFVAQFRIKRARGLVEEHHLGLHGQRARNRDSLLLAAGKLRRVSVGFFFEADFGQQLDARGFRLRPRRCPLRRSAPRVMFSQHGQVRKEIEGLKDHAGAHAQLPLLFALFAGARSAARPGW